MIELELSIMGRDPLVTENLRSRLQVFESQTGIRVHLRSMTWETGRSELTRTALYHHGPDISEIGTTWVGDLMAMNALRPFSPEEVAILGPAEDFLPASWQTCHLFGSKEALAIPWHTETFMLHYRSDLLKQAGIAESSAFKTHASLEQTVKRLGEMGVSVPIEFPIGGNYPLLHYWASWLWGAGADICTPDGKRTRFTEPEAMQATQNYLGLLRYCSPEALEMLRDRENFRLFNAGKSAIFISQPNLIHHSPNMPGEILKTVKMVDLPQAHFIGGSNLVIWRHTNEDRACLELITFLTRPEVLLNMPHQFLSLPSRLSVLNSSIFKGDPIKQLTAESILSGRTFPSVSLLGLMESRLVNALERIINSYVLDQTLDPADLAVKVLEPLARKLDVTLSQ